MKIRFQIDEETGNVTWTITRNGWRPITKVNEVVKIMTDGKGTAGYIGEIQI